MRFIITTSRNEIVVETSIENKDVFDRFDFGAKFNTVLRARWNRMFWLTRIKVDNLTRLDGQCAQKKPFTLTANYRSANDQTVQVLTYHICELRSRVPDETLTSAIKVGTQRWSGHFSAKYTSFLTTGMFLWH